ncbi:phosphate ABC transporter membrane protein 1, PhoT family [Natronoarchaeum philippinense]|uniref:Phosphate transport system permease protein n=1 Tax=Natronoarchaeum philippinense TaxID=558529 RepID=A0A285N3T3_NATPI|nr:phosphate ABC transporter permease subunit PstC [Natronoarchaeum philippinense]SNZ04090.1 phosphate ABC transporter membrane protein 1, PhoT family [Natronoarchaeum philippinense]
MSTTELHQQVRERFGVEAADDRVVALGAAGALCLLASAVAFLIGSSFTALPIVGFLLTVTYGLYDYQAETAKALSFLATIGTGTILALITVYLIVEALPAIRYMGADMFTYTSEPMWRTRGEEVYSLVPMIWGTLVTTILAMLIAGPLGVAGALFISEIAPDAVREIVKPAIETLAGIPSIVYGFIGFTILNDYMMENLELPTSGSLVIVGVVVGLMSLPTVVSVAEDAISSVPESMKSGSLALGTTDWQTIKSITIPAAFSGVSAAVLLGVGRAVGETMAATVILGHAQRLPDPLYDVFGNTETLTSLIASQYGVASSTHMNALFAAGVVLFVSVTALSIASQYVENRMQHQLQGES